MKKCICIGLILVLAGPLFSTGGFAVRYLMLERFFASVQAERPEIVLDIKAHTTPTSMCGVAPTFESASLAVLSRSGGTSSFLVWMPLQQSVPIRTFMEVFDSQPILGVFSQSGFSWPQLRPPRFHA